jgi:hypothetical protein
MAVRSAVARRARWRATITVLSADRIAMWPSRSHGATQWRSQDSSPTGGRKASGDEMHSSMGM